MKTLKVFFAAALVISSLTASANNEDGTKAASKVEVTMDKDRNVVEVLYSGNEASNVTITILNKANQIVFTETIKKKGAFIRPYNFSYLADGEYTIKIVDENGVSTKKVDFSNETYKPAVNQFIKVVEIKDQPKTFMLKAVSETTEDVYVYIYDKNATLVHKEKVDSNATKVYNLQRINSSSFTFEIHDKQGFILKSYTL